MLKLNKMEENQEYNCEICHKNFKTKSSLTVHLKTKCKSTEQSKKKDSFVCASCGKVLSSNQMLKYHNDTCVSHKLKKKEEEHNIDYSQLQKQIYENSLMMCNNMNNSLLLMHSDINKITIDLKAEFLEKMDKNQLTIETLKKELENIKTVQSDFDRIKKSKETVIEKMKEELRAELRAELLTELKNKLLQEIKHV